MALSARTWEAAARGRALDPRGGRIVPKSPAAVARSILPTGSSAEKLAFSSPGRPAVPRIAAVTLAAMRLPPAACTGLAVSGSFTPWPSAPQRPVAGS